MAYVDPNTVQDPTTGERILSAWGDVVRDDLEDHEGRIGTNETALAGLDQVDNTSDMEKPVSVHQQDALDLKANLAALDVVEDKVLDNDILVTTGDWGYISSAPTSVLVGRRGGYSMPAGSLSILGIQRMLPSTWQEYDAYLIWTRTGAEASADVRIQIGITDGEDGASASSIANANPGGAGLGRTVTPPLQDKILTSKLNPVVVPNTVGGLVLFQIYRAGTHAEDVFTGAVVYLAVLLRRVS